ncbi:unnamed protein product, partial [Cylicostephanus goldi]
VIFLTGALLVHETFSYGEFGEEDLNEYRKSKAEQLRQWLETLLKQEESQQAPPLKKPRKKLSENKRKTSPSRQSMPIEANSSITDDEMREQEKLRWEQRLDNYSRTDHGFGFGAEGLLFLGPPVLRGRQEFK